MTSAGSTEKAAPRKAHHVSYSSETKSAKKKTRKNATFEGAANKMYKHSDIRFQSGSRKFLGETVKGAIVHLASQANDLATKNRHKTLMCSHVQTVLDLNNFGKFKFALKNTC